MSKVQLSGNANGTGIFTIASPNSNTDRTVTLPDGSGTLAVQGGAGVGKVLQVVTATFSLDESTSSTSLVASSINLSITPSSASSRIFYIFTFNHQGTGSTTPNGVISAIFRNGSVPLNAGLNGGNLLYSVNASNIHSPVTLQGVDSPATTSAVSYRLYHARLSGIGTATSEIRNWGNQIVTLMEIAA